jgi:translation initiation factor 5B
MKVDRLYGWKPCPNAPIGKALRQQNEDVKMEFNTRLTDVCGHYNFLLFMKKKNS